LQTELQNTDVLIIEIGAYKIGHIARVCKYIRPNISILTAINEQHVSLFGSIKKTQQAKYEILRALPNNGLGIVNGDNNYCTELLHTVQASVKTFGKTGLNTDCELLSLDLKPNISTAQINFASKILTLKIPTHIVQYMTNILAAILVAKEKGLTDEQIQHSVYNLTLPTQGLRVYNYGTATIIDDSYSSNTDGFKLALDRLHAYPSSRKKVLVTRGMIELGTLHNDIHKNIGYKIAKIVNEVILITPDAADSITQGIKEKNSNIKIQYIYDAKKIVAMFKNFKDTSAVILIENRIPELLKTELKKYHVTT
jgi:UDP-N-acetylmuramoyl-tripeptide--D-alanyl-D-alanine ligase